MSEDRDIFTFLITNETSINNLNSIRKIKTMQPKFFLPPINHNINNSNSSFFEKPAIPLKKQTSSSDKYMGINQVLYWENPNQPAIYYVPAYLRVQVNRVTRMDYIGCVAEVDAYLTLWLMIRQLSQAVQDEIINYGELRINGNKGISLKDIIDYKNNSQSSINISKKITTFHTKQSLEMEIETDTFLSPFEVVNLLSTIEIRPVRMPNNIVKEEEKSRYEKEKLGKIMKFNNADIVFNFMETKTFVQFSFNELRNLGTFDLAEGRVGIKLCNEDHFGTMKFETGQGQKMVQNFILPAYTQDNNSEEKSDQQQNRLLLKEAPNAYQNAKIIIALYKYPMATIINVFVPFYLLSLLSLGLFFQSNDFTGRSISIFMLLTSYIAMIPGIRSSIPPTPNLIMIEIIVYLQTLCIVIIFVQSLIISDKQNYEFVWYEDGCFMIVLGYTVANFILITILCLLHKLKWEYEYNKLPDGTNKINSDNDQINTDEWYNDAGQKQFNVYLSSEKIKLFCEQVRELDKNNSHVRLIAVSRKGKQQDVKNKQF